MAGEVIRPEVRGFREAGPRNENGLRALDPAPERDGNEGGREWRRATGGLGGCSAVLPPTQQNDGLQIPPVKLNQN